MTSSAREVLPLGATPTFAGGKWSMRVPVRAEEIRLTKQTVVREHVVVRRKQIEEEFRVEATLRREELRASQSGEVEIGDQDAHTPPQQTSPATNHHV